jgi:hypothetical protein
MPLGRRTGKPLLTTRAKTYYLVAFTQFAADLPTANLPDYSFIVPNLCDDAHDCSLTVEDDWLKTNIDPVITRAVFQKDGMLVIVFDEADT